MMPRKHALSRGRTGDAQRLLRIEEEAPLKDQKIVLLEQRVSNLEIFIVFYSYSMRYALCAMRVFERGRDGETKIELGAPGDIGAGRFFPKKSGIPYYRCLIPHFYP